LHVFAFVIDVEQPVFIKLSLVAVVTLDFYAGAFGGEEHFKLFALGV
jgi:hypothetical protein